MNSGRLKIYGSASAIDRSETRYLATARPADRQTVFCSGVPQYRLFWGRIAAGAPGDPPDERYFVDEVRPAGADTGGHVEWESVPDGLGNIIVHNVAEASAGTHMLAEDTVICVEQRLDRASPPQMIYLANIPVAVSERLAKIVSYDIGAYTVQPVRRGTGGFVNDGPELSGVVNLGELWDDEVGYLAGPEAYDRYVNISWTPGGWVILLHPPRMV